MTNAAQDDILLRVRDLRREYPSPDAPLVVLDGVTFDLARGQSLSIMGRSGSGKSTLLQIIGALDRPTSGTVEIEGENPFRLKAKGQAAFRNRKIGFVFQDHHLLPQCTVLENVLIPSLVGRESGRTLDARARELIEKVGLTARIKHRPAELSGGERQRVAVARAMINRPPLLLCDEPTGNLDDKSSDAIGEIFRRLQSEDKTSLIVVTHSAAFAEKFDLPRRLSAGKLDLATL